MNCERCSKRLNPDWEFCPHCGSKVILTDESRLNSPGVKYFPEAFEPKNYRIGKEIAQDPLFYKTYIEYLLSFAAESSQLITSRYKPIREVQRIVGRRKQIVDVTWCSLSLATDKYFSEKALVYEWTEAEEEQFKSRWYEMMAIVFLPKAQVRRIDITVIKAWQNDFLELQKIDQGPLHACAACTSKCQYQYEVSELIKSDPALIADFVSCVGRDFKSNQQGSAAWFCQVLSKRMIGQTNVDFSYCIAVHLVSQINNRSTLTLSTDAKEVLLHQIRGALEGFGKADDDKDPGLAVSSGELRQKIFEAIVRQILTGNAWRETWFDVLKINNITPEAVESEVALRKEIS